MKRKRSLRSDSTWAKLTSDQRRILDSWMLDYHLSYADILVQVEQEFGIKASAASLSAYRTRRTAEAQLTQVASAYARANALQSMDINTETIRRAAINLIGTNVLDLTLNQPNALKELAHLTRLLVDNADVEDRCARTRLAQRRYSQETAAAAETDLIRLRALLVDIQENENLSEAEKTEEFKSLMRHLALE